MKKILWAFFLIGAMLLEWWWSFYFSVSQVAPQWLLIFTAALGAFCGPVFAQVTGFFWGLFLDLLGVHLFGAQALLLSMVGFVAGRLRRHMDVYSPAPQMVLMWLLSLMYPLAYGLLGLFFEGKMLWWGWKAFVCVPLLNALLSPFLFHFVRLIGGKD